MPRKKIKKFSAEFLMCVSFWFCVYFENFKKFSYVYLSLLGVLLLVKGVSLPLGLMAVDGLENPTFPGPAEDELYLLIVIERDKHLTKYISQYLDISETKGCH